MRPAAHATRRERRARGGVGGQRKDSEGEERCGEGKKEEEKENAKVTRRPDAGPYERARQLCNICVYIYICIM
jgi:hypothetical protein